MDNCPGQNKNYTLVLLLTYLAYTTRREIEIVYPEKGHTFLPSDRCFGNVEKKLRKHSELSTFKDYQNVFSEIDDIKIIKEDFDFFQIKKNFPNKINKNHLFKISKVRRINFTGRKITYSNTYGVPITEVKLTEKDLEIYEIGQLDKSSYLNTVSPENRAMFQNYLKRWECMRMLQSKLNIFLKGDQHS